MQSYLQMTKPELEAEFSSVKAEYEKLRAMHLSLDMSRGKPGFDNMDISQKMFDLVGNDTGFKNIDGIDCRNYGGLDGLTEMKKIFADILELEENQIIVGGNSSLNMMFDTVAQAMTHGMGGEPRYECKNRKFLCPSPGYDRHFAITQYFGFELFRFRQLRLERLNLLQFQAMKTVQIWTRLNSGLKTRRLKVFGASPNILTLLVTPIQMKLYAVWLL